MECSGLSPGKSPPVESDRREDFLLAPDGLAVAQAQTEPREKEEQRYLDVAQEFQLEVFAQVVTGLE